MKTSVFQSQHLPKPHKLVAVLAALALALAIFSIPAVSFAANGYLEDCDFDGYDDVTHAPVPWFGFDGTKGDKVPGDWDGKAGSYVFKSTTGSTGSKSTNTSTGTKSTSKSTGTKSSSTKSTAATSTKTTTSTESTAAATSSSATADKADAQEAVKADKADSGAQATQMSAEAAAVVKTVGSLHIAPAVGTEFTAGADIVIDGYFFAPDVKALDIYLVTGESEVLANADTAADGSFAASAKLPMTLEPGDYSVVIAYQGVPIVKRSISVVEAAAVTTEIPAEQEPLVAQSAAVPGQSNPINPVGLIILAALAAVCAATLLVWKATQSRRMSLAHVDSRP